LLYKQFKDLKLSALGYGCMRLPSIGTGRDAPIDEEEAKACLTYAYENGVNYFDSAYGYHGGESERVAGRILKQFPRDSFYLATKFPGHMGHTTDVEEVFAEQLQKCQVDYFDFYLLHNVNDTSINIYSSSELKIVEKLLRQKEAGKIRHFGFSSHARPENIEVFLKEFPGVFEFCQIQLNYLDWTLQNAKAKVEILTAHNIPVWVMEPVRGGKLASLSPEREALLKSERPDETVAAWAFRWLQSVSNIGMVLSGMSSLDQVKDNIKTFSEDAPLTAKEKELLENIAADMSGMIPCTACRYCCDGCPQELDIPLLLSLYNDARYDFSFAAMQGIQALPEDKRPAACVACGQCSEVCPQNIDVPAAMEGYAKILSEMGARRF